MISALFALFILLGGLVCVGGILTAIPFEAEEKEFKVSMIVSFCGFIIAVASLVSAALI